MVWTECVECQTTCANQHLSCPRTSCRSGGCACPADKVLNTQTGECVEPTLCPCNFRGQVLAEGETVKVDCNYWSASNIYFCKTFIFVKHLLQAQQLSRPTAE